MEDKEKVGMLKWIHCWEQAGAIMEKTRQADLDHLDVRKSIETLDDAFEAALLHCPPKLTSGLVEMQGWLARARS